MRPKLKRHFFYPEKQKSKHRIILTFMFIPMFGLEHVVIQFLHGASGSTYQFKNETSASLLKIKWVEKYRPESIWESEIP